MLSLRRPSPFRRRGNKDAVAVETAPVEAAREASREQTEAYIWPLPV